MAIHHPPGYWLERMNETIADTIMGSRVRAGHTPITKADWIAAFAMVKGVYHVDVSEDIGQVRFTVHLRGGVNARQARIMCEAIVREHAPIGLDIGFTIVEHNIKPYWPEYLGQHLPPHNVDLDDIITERGK